MRKVAKVTRAEKVRSNPAEDREDLKAFEERAHERPLPFEEVLKDIKKRGKL